MRLKLKNICLLKEADVSIDGLSVITGENDTGKSTIGKVLFCIIKAISRYDEDFKESKKHRIRNISNELYFLIRKYASAYFEGSREHKKSKELVELFIKTEINEENIDKYIENVKQFITNNKPEFDDAHNNKIGSLLKKLQEIVTKKEDKTQSIENALKRVFSSEFNLDILKHGTNTGYIKLYEKDLLLLDVRVNKNNQIKLKQAEPIEIKEATFIETPLILNNHDLLSKSQSVLKFTNATSRRLGIPYTTIHTKDLFDKLTEPDWKLFPNNEDIYDYIQKIINGNIVYDSESKDFLYIKQEKNINIKNTATGIKAFGIIQILLDNDFINKKSVLIIDEPEIHLHPKWQLKYAQLITKLVSKGVPIMIASHSPYMIEALERYSKIKKIQNTNFYLSKNEKIINDKNSLSSIFKVLSEPFEEFEKMDAKTLKDE